MIVWVIVGALALLLAFALLSPLESLRWWSRRRDVGSIRSLTRAVAEEEGDAEAPDGGARRFVVYLSGIGAVDGVTDSRRERAVLEALSEALPDVVVTADVFPYAVDNRGLTQRATTWFWRRLKRLQRVPVASTLSNLISLRNALRVLVSADPRYGPTFNLAVAQEIVASLTRHGYPWARRPPVTIIGYSGGGQMALGATWYLAALDVDVSVISIGGVMADDPALDRVDHLWHLYGTKDRMHRIGDVLFPGRWRTTRLSAWNVAVHDGRITREVLGPMRHMGGRDYFDRHETLDDGRSYRQATIDALVTILRS